MNVEHLWFSSKPLQQQDTRLAESHISSASVDSTEEDMVQTLTVMADKRLYKLVKWCKSLPLFKNILVRQFEHTARRTYYSYNFSFPN